MESLKREKLKEMIDEDEDFVLINVLSRESFNQQHIPKSINITLEKDNFEEEVLRRIPDKNKKIVVYCASFDCQASIRAAKKLDKLGYKNVYDYEGGISDWKKSDYELISA